MSIRKRFEESNPSKPSAVLGYSGVSIIYVDTERGRCWSMLLKHTLLSSNWENKQSRLSRPRFLDISVLAPGTGCRGSSKKIRGRLVFMEKIGKFYHQLITYNLEALLMRVV